MSSCVEFFIKDMNRIISVGSFSRSHEVYNAFEGAPYGKLGRLDTVRICKAAEKLRGEIQQLVEDQATLFKEEKDIWGSNNPLSEKREAVAQVRESLTEIDELIKEKTFALDVIRTLDIMSDYLDVYEDSDEAVRGARLFYGVDVEFKNSEEEKI